MPPAASKNSVLARRGVPMRIKKRASSGFDYPTQLVGTSKWVGSDGKPVTVYFDPSTGPTGQSVAQYVLSKIEDVMASCDVWFGTKGLGGNVIVAPDFGGAYHYGCSFTDGGDWYLSLSSPDTTVGLAVAEITESYMGLQAKGWNCGGSGGEALSRVLAEVATGGASGAMVDYSAGPSWDGSNWVDADQGSDQDYPSIGCGVLYLWWMLKQGYTMDKIVQAGEPGGTLAGNWSVLTGQPRAGAWSAFQAACGKVGAPGNINTDNPFGATNPTYPATGGGGGGNGGGGGGGGGSVVAKGELDFFGQKLPITLTIPTGSTGVPVPKMLIDWALVAAEVARLVLDLRAANWVAAAADMEALLKTVTDVVPGEGLTQFSKAVSIREELSALDKAAPPK